MAATDSALRPPISEVLTSPDGRVTLTIAIVVPPGSAAAQHAMGTLRRNGADIWRRSFLAHIRPRLALVANSGRVALFGQWENTPGDMAIEVLGLDGNIVALLARADIERAVGLPAAQIIPLARHGAWLDRLPAVEGDRVLLGAAGRPLVLDQATGRLTPAP